EYVGESGSERVVREPAGIILPGLPVEPWQRILRFVTVELMHREHLPPEGKPAEVDLELPADPQDATNQIAVIGERIRRKRMFLLEGSPRIKAFGEAEHFFAILQDRENLEA